MLDDFGTRIAPTHCHMGIWVIQVAVESELECTLEFQVPNVVLARIDLQVLVTNVTSISSSNENLTKTWRLNENSIKIWRFNFILELHLLVYILIRILMSLESL